ncbi:hypothetical protein CTT39_21805 [Agrobacterium rosae]|nr:hypothetical protein CTT39_21805 [Agrobacterium rosae]
MLATGAETIEADRDQTRQAQEGFGTRRPLALQTRPNEPWSLDFVSNAIPDSRRPQVLAVVYDFTCECLGLRV